MKFVLAVLVCSCLAAHALAADSATAPATAPLSTAAAVVVLDGEIDDFSKTSVEKRFEEARRLGAHTIILQINTYGGLVTSGLEISHFLKQQDDLHVIAFVDEKAISAGSMIAMACNEIVMQPGSKLGDCAPISLTSGGELQTMGQTERAKMESPILLDFEESAQRNGYDPLLVTSMVSLSRTVHWVENDKGERRFVDDAEYKKLTDEGWKPVAGVHDPVAGGSTLLTVNPELAMKLGLAKAIESSPESLAASRGLNIIASLETSAGEELIGFLGSATVRGILTTVFMLAIYFAMSHPGHGVPEVIAAAALIVLVGVPLLTGYATWWEILMILIGLVLLALEIFVIPGLGVTAISGIALVIVGLTLTFVGREPVTIPGFTPRLEGTWTALQHGLIIVVGGMVCSLLLWFWLQRYISRLPYFNRLVLGTTSGQVNDIGASLTTNIADTWPRVGARGRAITELRPGGQAAFHDDLLGDDRTTDVISDSGFVVAGTEVVVRQVEGTRVVVRTVKDER